MSRASTPTLLSLDRFARIMGINPAHFNGAAGSDIMPIGGSCSDIWWQETWHGADRVSREDLARTIASVEKDIADYLGYWPAPVWFSREMHRYERHHRRDVFGTGIGVRQDYKSVKLNWGRFVSAGRRATTLIGAGALVASDPDGDTFNELYTVTIATTLASDQENEVKCYVPGHGSDPEWEIRNPKDVVITGGFATITFDFWQVIDPAKQSAFPTMATRTALDITTAIYLATVNVYREFTDFSQHSVELYWEPRYYGSDVLCPACGGGGCAACDSVVQCGCIHPRNIPLGIVVPIAADWDVTAATWVPASAAMCIEPDEVNFWYYAGDLSGEFLSGSSHDPLDRRMAETIAYMTVARLERPFCTCGNLAALQNSLRAEYARSDRDGPSWYMTDRDSDNPFGTRKGELMAWKRLKGLASKIPKVALV